MFTNFFPIAKEGLKYILSATVTFILFYTLDFDFLTFVSFISIILFIYLYRNPERELLVFERDNVLSPVDGVITSIESIQDAQYTYKVQIKTSHLDVGVLRVPFDATLQNFDMKYGTRLSTTETLSASLNENVALVFTDNKSHSLKLEHTLDKSFASLHIDLIKDKSYKQVSRYGHLPYGLTSIYFPSNFRLNVHVGTHLKASQTLLGFFS